MLCCGRYEGIDERAHDLVATDEVSIGDYVLFGGEVAAAAVIEAVTRHVPGVMGNAASPEDESFSPRPDGRHRCSSTRSTPAPPRSAATASPRC